MRVLRVLIMLGILFCSALEANCASIIPICRNLRKNVKNCLPHNIFFATYSPTNNIMKYKVDRGPIGEIQEANAKNYTDEILGLWETNSGIDFQSVGDGFIPVNVTKSNYRAYLNNRRPLGYSPVIWDENGTLMNDLFGEGARFNVLGFAGSTFFKTRKKLAQGIIESQSVFNGYLFNGDHTGDDSASVINNFKSTILHEFGHMFGLDHSQGGDLETYLNFNPETDNPEILTNIPIMFPVAANPLVALQQDDISAIRLGYPKGDEANLYGTITGVLKQLGSGVKGANVIAYPIDDANPFKNAVACPSDVDGKGLGKFTLPNLVPGNYIIKTEPINENFVGGSSVGIHNPIYPLVLLNGSHGFYMGEGELPLRSSDLNTGIAQAFKINVEAGSTTNINFDLDLATFKIHSKLSNSLIVLKKRKKRVINLVIKNFYPGQLRSLNLSTDYPDLIEFLPARVDFRKKYITIKVRLDSYLDFLSQFPALNNGSIYIPIEIEDLNTGYILDTQELWLF
jgi:hypothetical protein